MARSRSFRKIAIRYKGFIDGRYKELLESASEGPKSV